MKIWKRPFCIIYCLIGLSILFALDTFFSGSFLNGTIKPNDYAFNLHLIEWFDRWFPRIPQWYPLQGGGMSIIRGYALFPHLVTMIISKILPLDPNQAMRLVSFFIFFLTSSGIYFFTWIKLKSQTIALIAGIFYFLSLGNLSWLTYVGLYAQSFSLIFFPWVLIFFDRYLNKLLNQENDLKKRIYFVLTVLTVAGGAISHFVTLNIIFETIFLYGFFYTLFLVGKNASFSFRINKIKQIFTKTAMIILVSLLLASFLLLPFFSYRSYAGREGTIWPAVEQIRSIPPLLLLQLRQRQDYSQEYYIETYSFAIPIWILALVGFIFSLKKKNIFILTTGVISLLIIFQLNLPRISQIVVKLLIFFLGTMQARAIIPLTIFIPILAGYGIWCVTDLILIPTIRFWDKLKLRNIISTVLTILIACLVIFFWKEQVNQAPRGFFLDEHRSLASGNWNYKNFVPSLRISKDRLLLEKESGILNDLTKKFSLDNKTRFDISINLHHLVQAMPLYSDASILAFFEGYSVLNKTMSGYRNAAYNLPEPKNKNYPRIINELTQWFGINYLFLNKVKDPLERFDDKWQNVDEKDDIVIKKFINNIPLASLSNRPTILVIGRYDNKAYDQVFRAGNAGAISYDQAWLVEGKDSGNIDDYTLTELNNFDIVFLYGYRYKNQSQAWSLLDQYVSQGGKLFIETGWQYVSPDWQWEKTANIIPLEKLTWQEFSTWDIEGFSPPSYQGSPWGVSTGKNIKNWAEPILASQGNVMIARGMYGKGKIVWSGMNIIGHANTYQNTKEFDLISNLINFLKEPLDTSEIAVSFERKFPDRVEFLLPAIDRSSSLYWRESYFSDWQSKLIINNDGELSESNLKIYRAGPEYMLIRIPKLDKSSKIILQFSYTIVIIGYIITFFTGITLLIYLLRPTLFTFFKGFLPGTKLSDYFKSWWNKEDSI